MKRLFNPLFSMLLVFSFLLLIGSCKKKDSPQILYIDNSFKEWVLFQKGTYWIYLNEGNTFLDSSIVSTNPESGYYPPLAEAAAFHYETIRYKIANSFINNAEIARDYNGSSINFGTYYPDGVVFPSLFNGYTNASWLGSSDYCSFVEKIDSMIINTNKFKNVIHTRVVNSYYNNLQFDFYFVKNVGWVKYSIKTSTMDTTWSILRYHVVQ
jgi:hypothetical protein